MADSSSASFSIEEFSEEEKGEKLPNTDPPLYVPDQNMSRSSTNLQRHQGKETRSRTESASESSETDNMGELHQFRTRSRSAPSSLLVAARYGRELRRMSDEFDQTFKGLPRPKSAGAEAQLFGKRNIGEMFMTFWGWRRSKGKKEVTDDVM
ncbi:bcl2-associated agonist of cell death [Spea bombifrons]|uniref:bcl2-associated agonist of cell death n=1 Tax=Spea bombifrons TaxID=233779 RepID=UPI00234B0A4E|nr:bcl2-associated agonist of cell death [Spea bombifrons]XP_053305024.1 bcl2-associated agonist of cell death [Spea bombifrons]